MFLRHRRLMRAVTSLVRLAENHGLGTPGTATHAPVYTAPAEITVDQVRSVVLARTGIRLEPEEARQYLDAALTVRGHHTPAA